jgi:hypothetical protein
LKKEERKRKYVGVENEKKNKIRKKEETRRRKRNWGRE